LAPYKLPWRSEGKTLPIGTSRVVLSMRVPASRFSLWHARTPLGPMTVRPMGGGDARSTPGAHDMKSIQEGAHISVFPWNAPRQRGTR